MSCSRHTQDIEPGLSFPQKLDLYHSKKTCSPCCFGFYPLIVFFHFLHIWNTCSSMVKHACDS